MAKALDLKQDSVISVVKYHKRSAEEYSNFIDTLIIAKKELPVIIDGKYFQIAELDGQKIKAICMQCTKMQVISATVDATSNLLRHMKVSLFYYVLFTYHLYYLKTSGSTEHRIIIFFLFFTLFHQLLHFQNHHYCLPFSSWSTLWDVV